MACRQAGAESHLMPPPQPPPQSAHSIAHHTSHQARSWVSLGAAFTIGTAKHSRSHIPSARCWVSLGAAVVGWHSLLLDGVLPPDGQHLNGVKSHEVNCHLIDGGRLLVCKHKLIVRMAVICSRPHETMVKKDQPVEMYHQRQVKRLGVYKTSRVLTRIPQRAQSRNKLEGTWSDRPVSQRLVSQRHS